MEINYRFSGNGVIASIEIGGRLFKAQNSLLLQAFGLSEEDAKCNLLNTVDRHIKELQLFIDSQRTNDSEVSINDSEDFDKRYSLAINEEELKIALKLVGFEFNNDVANRLIKIIEQLQLTGSSTTLKDIVKLKESFK